MKQVLIGGFVLVIVALVPAYSPWVQFLLATAMAKGFAALGVAVLLRAGLISLGHAMFFAIGAYAVAFLQSSTGTTDFVLLLLLATVVAGVLAAFIGAFMVRYRAIFFAMLNLAVSMVLFALLSKLYGLTGGSDGMRVEPPTFFGHALGSDGTALLIFYASIVLVLLVGVGVHRYLASPLGRALSAVHTNEIRLEYLGIPVWGVLLVAYAISGALAGLGGALMAMSIGHVLPDMAFWTESGHLMLVAVLGGIAGVAGPFAGSVFLELVHTAAVTVTDAWNAITGVALLLVIFFLPGGLYGILQGRRKETI